MRGGSERHPRADTSTEISPSLQSPIQTPSPLCSFPDFLHTHNNNGFFAPCSQTVDIAIKPITTFCPVLESNLLLRGKRDNVFSQSLNACPDFV